MTESEMQFGHYTGSAILTRDDLSCRVSAFMSRKDVKTRIEWEWFARQPPSVKYYYEGDAEILDYGRNPDDLTPEAARSNSSFRLAFDAGPTLWVRVESVRQDRFGMLFVDFRSLRETAQGGDA